MSMSSPTPSILYKTIKWLSRDLGFHISIHDTSGIIHSINELELPIEYKIHSCNFCDYAKTTSKGLRACLKCKSLSISKALHHKGTFTGICYLGVTEIVKPVIYEGTLLCIIFIGNLLDITTKKETLGRIDRLCSITGVDRVLLREKVNSLKHVEKENLIEYVEIAEILENLILSRINDKSQIKAPTTCSPMYRGTHHWIVQSVQNYIFAYYNKDLNLSQLAKLHFVNPQYLCRLFKKETGIHLSKYINNQRITRAKHLLLTTSDCILEIALIVGYNNVTYFNKLFKNLVGCSPSQYRDKNIPPS